MVECSGLENLAGKAPETAETAELCGFGDAQDALFTGRSEGGDGTRVGTLDEALRAATALEEFRDEDDWRAPPPSGAGFFVYCPIRFLAYLERFGPKPGEGKPPLLPPNVREMSEEQHAKMADRGYPEYTYFARGKLTGRIKIGFSTQPEYRICQLQHCRNGESAEELLILRGNLEKAYHNVFWRWHEGNEWFAPHPDILAEIERLSK